MSKSMQIRKEKEVMSFPGSQDLRLLIAEILFDMFKYKQKTWWQKTGDCPKKRIELLGKSTELAGF